MTEFKNKKEKLEYMRQRLAICKNDYERCMKYAVSKNPEEAESICSYLKQLVDFWERNIAKEQQSEGN